MRLAITITGWFLVVFFIIRAYRKVCKTNRNSQHTLITYAQESASNFSRGMIHETVFRDNHECEKAVFFNLTCALVCGITMNVLLDRVFPQFPKPPPFTAEETQQ